MKTIIFALRKIVRDNKYVLCVICEALIFASDGEEYYIQ